MERELFLSLPFFERALALATIKHAGQIDKAGKPYVMHVIRVMEGVEDHEEKVIALLHDIVEDTDFTFEDLKMYDFSDVIIHGVKLLTRAPGKEYMSYVKELSTHQKARNVKLSDLRDNQDHTRLNNPMTKEDQERLQKYSTAEAFLLDVIEKEENTGLNLEENDE